MRFIPCATSPSRSLLFSFRALLAVCVVAAMAIAAHAQTPPAPAGPTEGIKVHGHWTIDIKNADGTLASHHEFENAFVNPEMLANILMGGNTPGGWRIRLASNNNAADMPCGPSKPCLIRQPHAVPANYEGESTNLAVSLVLPAAPTPSAVLHFDGSITAGQGSPRIAAVTSQLSICSGFTAPSQCLNPSYVVDITEHLLAAPITVAPGQIIQVTVDITIS